MPTIDAPPPAAAATDLRQRPLSTPFLVTSALGVTTAVVALHRAVVVLEQHGALGAVAGTAIDAGCTLGLVVAIGWGVTRRRARVGQTAATGAAAAADRHHATEQQLQASEERFRLIADNIAEVFWIADVRDRRVRYVSPAYETIWGRPAKQLYESLDAYDVTIHPDDRARVLATTERHQLGGAFDHEYRIVRPDGTLRWIWDRGFPVRNAAGTLTDFVGVAMDVTQRKRVEAQLQLMGYALESASEMISITSLDHAFLFVNRAFLETYGYTRDEVLGRTPDMLAAAPDEASQRLSHIRAESLKGSWTGTLANRRKDGTTFHVHLSTSPIRDASGAAIALIGVARDITDELRMIEVLRSSEARFRALFEQAAVGIALVSMDGAFIRGNEAFARIVGYAVDELPAQNFRAITHPDDLARDLGELQRLVRGEFANVTLEKRYVRKNGTPVWAQTTISVVRRADGALDYYIALVSDITDRRELEAQLRQNQKMEAIGQLAGGVAHDFNNLLLAIRGHVDLIKLSGPVAAPLRESLDEIERATQRAASLTRQLLLFSRREIIQPRQLNLNDSIQTIAKMLNRLLGEGITVELQLHRAPLPVRGDPGMIDQILLNLAVNARDAMQSHGVLTIATAVQTIDAATARRREVTAGDFAQLSVHDTGCGIAADVLPHIFEPFFTTKPAGHGTGLGLATIFGIVKQHGGWIAVQTEVGRGTTFDVFLPLTESAPPPAPPATTATRKGRGHTILLVEDDEAVRAMAAALLRLQGYTVVAAANGSEALLRWKETGGAIDLLLTDMIMPGGVSGAELAATLQAERPTLPVLLTSGYNAEIAGRVLHLGPRQRFLQKPFEVPDLLATLDELLDSHTQPATPA